MGGGRPGAPRGREDIERLWYGFKSCGSPARLPWRQRPALRRARAEGVRDMSRAASDTPPQGREPGVTAPASAGTETATGAGEPATAALTHLQRLEAQSIHILRDGVAAC